VLETADETAGATDPVAIGDETLYSFYRDPHSMADPMKGKERLATVAR
jgi:hypothetical protein